MDSLGELSIVKLSPTRPQEPEWDDCADDVYPTSETPPSEVHSQLQRNELSDVESDGEGEIQGKKQSIKPKQGGYDSRIEQILYENPDLPILITDAGKSSESGGKYIVYTIRTGVSSHFIHTTRLTIVRNLRFADVTLNLRLSEMH